MMNQRSEDKLPAGRQRFLGQALGMVSLPLIQGPTFLIEYDNIQNNANHIHSVWRDFNGDFGLDLLAIHYQKDHR